MATNSCWSPKYCTKSVIDCNIGEINLAITIVIFQFRNVLFIC